MHDIRTLKGGLWATHIPFRPRDGRIFYGWWVMAVSTLGILFSIPGQTMGFSVFTEILMRELGLSRVGLSAAYCAGTVASGLTLPALGRLYDRWGGRKLAVAAVLATAAVLVYLSAVARLNDSVAAFLPSAWRAASAFVLIGLGFYLIRLSAQGVLTMSCRNLVGEWFDRRRGAALAIGGTVTSFAFSAAPKFLDRLIASYGHEGAWLVLAALSALVMAPLAWAIFRDTPEKCGLVMDGGVPEGFVQRNQDMIIHRELNREEALRSFAFWAFALSFAYFACYNTAYTFHIVSLGAEFGFSKTDIIALFIPIAAVSVGVNLLFGWLNAFTRLKWLLLAMNLGGAVGAVGLWSLDSGLGQLGYVIGNGVCSGGYMALFGLVWPRYYGRRWLGAISGVNMSLTVIASGLGPLLFGASEQFFGSYGPALAISIAAPACLAVASLWANNPQRRIGESE